jgi:hypothetical protein
MLKEPNNIQPKNKLISWQGFIFASLTTVLTIFLLPWIDHHLWDSPPPNRLGGTLILSAFSAVTLGAFLKRLPMQARLGELLAKHPKEVKNISATAASFGLVVFGSFFLFGMHLLAGPLYEGIKGIWGLTFLLGLIPALLMQQIFFPPVRVTYPRWMRRPIMEVFANLLLYFGILFAISTVNFFVRPDITNGGVWWLLVRIIATVLLCYTFYIPAAAPLLFEEYYRERLLFIIEIVMLTASMVLLAIRTMYN